jgi:DNA-binding response OmpR family regulator
MLYLFWRKLREIHGLFPEEAMSQIQERTTSKLFTHLKVILLVGNDDTALHPLAEALSENVHYHLVVASSAFAAVKFLRHITPHLLIVDECLSDMSGIQLYDYLHANRGLATLPVIMLCVSVVDMRGELTARKLIGLSKAFDPGEFITTIEAIFATTPFG